ncbi:hypothetical protein FA95DRAFT_1577384 [Auriscalpium vulgare]|uniref:Uncharacterized protein n=1 Tax=Auriscalpium vulgare TaxID=40419 RepID=A0ACB8R864_9AGAM|nr:hypothetical protein FA95DRAFT_1577384 [Auriscalpium vulgare]
MPPQSGPPRYSGPSPVSERSWIAGPRFYQPHFHDPARRVLLPRLATSRYALARGMHLSAVLMDFERQNKAKYEKGLKAKYEKPVKAKYENCWAHILFTKKLARLHRGMTLSGQEQNNTTPFAFNYEQQCLPTTSCHYSLQMEIIAHPGGATTSSRAEKKGFIGYNTHRYKTDRYTTDRYSYTAGAHGHAAPMPPMHAYGRVAPRLVSSPGGSIAARATAALRQHAEATWYPAAFRLSNSSSPPPFPQPEPAPQPRFHRPVYDELITITKYTRSSPANSSRRNRATCTTPQPVATRTTRNSASTAHVTYTEHVTHTPTATPTSTAIEWTVPVAPVVPAAPYDAAPTASVATMASGHATPDASAGHTPTPAARTAAPARSGPSVATDVKKRVPFTGGDIVTLVQTAVALRMYMQERGNITKTWELLSTQMVALGIHLSAAVFRTKADDVIAWQADPDTCTASLRKLLDSPDGITVAALTDVLSEHKAELAARTDQERAKALKKLTEDQIGGNAIRAATMRASRRRAAAEDGLDQVEDAVEQVEHTFNTKQLKLKQIQDAVQDAVEHVKHAKHAAEKFDHAVEEFEHAVEHAVGHAATADPEDIIVIDSDSDIEVTPRTPPRRTVKMEPESPLLPVDLNTPKAKGPLSKSSVKDEVTTPSLSKHKKKPFAKLKRPRKTARLRDLQDDTPKKRLQTDFNIEGYLERQSADSREWQNKMLEMAARDQAARECTQQETAKYHEGILAFIGKMAGSLKTTQTWTFKY